MDEDPESQPGGKRRKKKSSDEFLFLGKVTKECEGKARCCDYYKKCSNSVGESERDHPQRDDAQAGPDEIFRRQNNS
jgi:hypothetical protein